MHQSGAVIILPLALQVWTIRPAVVLTRKPSNGWRRTKLNYCVKLGRAPVGSHGSRAVGIRGHALRPAETAARMAAGNSITANLLE